MTLGHKFKNTVSQVSLKDNLCLCFCPEPKNMDVYTINLPLVNISVDVDLMLIIITHATMYHVLTAWFLDV